MFFKPKFDIRVEQVKQDLLDKDVYLLDVRTVEEYQEGHLHGAHLIPVDQLENRIQEIPKDKPIYVYCRSGQRAKSAKSKLLAHGYCDVYNFGGIMQWPYEVEK